MRPPDHWGFRIADCGFVGRPSNPQSPIRNLCVSNCHTLAKPLDCPVKYAATFRQRIFVILVALTAVPTALAVVGWALAVRTVGPSAGARVALERSEERRVGK